MRGIIWIFLMAALLTLPPLFTNIFAAPYITVENRSAGVETANGEQTALLVLFSETEHFYDRNIEIEMISSVPGAEIYFTIDGSAPTKRSRRYAAPLRYSAASAVNAVTLKAFAVYGDTISPVKAHTYFIGKNVFSRFDTLVFSLSTDRSYLYDYDTGIFAEGRLRDEYISANPSAEIKPPDPANYNMRGRESERPVYVEIFTPAGERVAAQLAGMRNHGGWSRASSQKSIRLYARNSYEEGAGKFRYDFFPGETLEDGYGTPLQKYDRLILRNGANTRDFCLIRNEVASKLARDAGLRVVTPARAASVFLNGEYYGFAWLQVRIDEKYLQDMYNTPTDEFDIIDNGDLWIGTDDPDVYNDAKKVRDYRNKDLTDDVNFKELEKLVDIDNMLLYYAFEAYLDNRDWPGNNMKKWRYSGPPVENGPPELDGRWRYILYDLDMLLGLYGPDYTQPSFEDILGGDRNSPLLSALLKRRDMQNKFAAVVCDLANHIITEKNVTKHINELYGEAKQEINASFAAGKYSSWTSIRFLLENHRQIIDFARMRSTKVFSFLEERYGYRDFYEIKVGSGEAKINGITAKESKYFTGISVPVSPVLDRHHIFDYWLVNGQKRETPDIRLSDRDGLRINLQLITRYEPPALVLENAYAGDLLQGCVLANKREQPVNTKGLFLGDSLDNLQRWALPERTMEADGKWELAGRGSSDADDKTALSFRLRGGRVLYLSDAEGRILDYWVIP